MAAEADRAREALLRLVQSALPSIDFLAAYPCRVVAQNSDGTLELQPDDARFPGLSNIPIRYGVPGIKATVAPGARVLLGFASGNPAMPQAELWEMASVTKLEVTATQIVLNGGTQPIARVGDTAGPYPIVGGNPTILG